MPVLRYFVVIGCCLLGLLFAVDYLVPKEATRAKAETATAANGGSLASWRQSQEKLDKTQTATAVVYPAIAPLPPTSERLQWERQLTFRKADAPATPSQQARAEVPATAAEAIAPPAPVKSAAKTPSRHKTVVRVERRERGYDRPNYAAAYPPAPVGQYGYRQAQFDRPFGSFFGRMF